MALCRESARSQQGRRVALRVEEVVAGIHAVVDEYYLVGETSIPTEVSGR